MSEKQKRIFFLTLALLSAVFFFGCSFMDSYGKIYRFEKNPFIFPDNLQLNNYQGRRNSSALEQNGFIASFCDVY